MSVTKQGLSAIVETTGNNRCHVILRGGQQGPNYDAESIQSCAAALKKHGLSDKIMIDCSHGNSQKKHQNQILVVQDLCEQMESLGSHQSTASLIAGVMIESNLVAGRQDLGRNLETLVYGQSVTDACIDWDVTVRVLDRLKTAVQKRRVLAQS